MTDGSVVVCVAGEEQTAGDEVMGEHLPVVLTTLLNVEDNNLLDPEGLLREDVGLHEARDFLVWPMGLHLLEVEEVGRLAVHVLSGTVSMYNGLPQRE
jgi:hypothetical protein